MAKKLPVAVRTRYTEQSFRDDIAALNLSKPILGAWYHRDEIDPWEVHYYTMPGCDSRITVRRYPTKKAALADLAARNQ